MEKLSKIDALRALISFDEPLTVSGVKITPELAKKLVSAYDVLDRQYQKKFVKLSIQGMINVINHTTTESIRESSSNEFEIDSFYKQTFKNGDTAYFLPKGQHKNGNWFGLLYTVYEGERLTGRPKNGSVSNTNRHLWKLADDIDNKIKQRFGS